MKCTTAIGAGIVAIALLATGVALVPRAPVGGPAPAPQSIGAPAQAGGDAADVTAPTRFSGWNTWSTTRRTAVIAEVVGDPRLDQESIAFLMRQLEDPALDPGTRNNVANALMGQDRRPAGLAAMFLRMVDDPRETMTWREYSVQRLVATLAPDEDARPLAARLIHLVRHGEGPLPGSALIQLELLVRAGRGEAAQAYADLLVDLARRPQAPLENRMTAIAKLGETGDPSQAPVVRALLTPDAAPALVRVAVATLGLIGAPEDVRLVERYLDHPNRAVVLAAKAALKRLEARAAL
jgi:hypothetical protein